MSQADDIRRYIIAEYIEPARARGDDTVCVRAGDVHRGMGFTKNRMPNVCNALGNPLIRGLGGVELIRAGGVPSGQGASMRYKFRILA